MTVNILYSSFKAAEIHRQRLESAMTRLKPYFPISAQKIAELITDELAMFELYTSRFCKLQDLMGSQLLTLVLEAAKEPVEQMSMIDKINKLEKLRAIENAETWKKLRDIRNHLSHEYPDDPEITAVYLNEAYAMGTTLIDCLKRLEMFARGIDSTFALRGSLNTGESLS
jgi:hypothetical protein